MKDTFKHWLIGTLSSLGSIGITLTDVEQWIRVAGGLVGLIVGLLTLYSMIRKLRKGE